MYKTAPLLFGGMDRVALVWHCGVSTDSGRLRLFRVSMYMDMNPFLRT